MTNTISRTSKNEEFSSSQSPERAIRFDEELLRSILEAEPQIDKESGLKVVQLDVKDGYEQYSEDRAYFDSIAAQCQQLLMDHPDWKAPERPQNEAGKTAAVIPRNDVSRMLYEDEASRQWGRHMPDSYALWNLYHPEEDVLPDGTPVTSHMKEVFRHLLDARGIRIRGNVIEALGIKQAERNGSKDFWWISHGGGAFAPAMHTAQTLSERMPNTPLRISTYDLDQRAMEFGQVKAEELGLTKAAKIETHVTDLRKELISRDSPLVQEVAGQGGATFVENSGLTEYFNKGIATRLVESGYNSTAPGGCFVFSNMRDDRPELDLNQRGVGWNKMYIRSLPQLAELLESAGIDPSLATVYQPSDGLYSIVEIPKPAIETPEQRSSSITTTLGNVATSS